MICAASIVYCCLIVKLFHTLLSELYQIGVVAEKFGHMHGQYVYVRGDMSCLIDGCEIYHPLFSILSKTHCFSLCEICSLKSCEGEKNPAIELESSQH